MKILHIANDYSGSEVYKELITELDKLECTQIIYTAVRNEFLIGKNEIFFLNSSSHTIYSNILKFYDRLNFYHKINKIVNDIILKVDFDNVNIIHAHTWYSDGAVAYELYKKYKIPYTKTVRNTDLNVFYKYMVHLRKYGAEILKNAIKIVFISNVYKDRFLNTQIFKSNKALLNNNLVILFNGINQFWIENVKERKRRVSQLKFKLLFVGKFDRGKNVLNLIKAVNNLNRNEIKYSLTLVGGGGNQHEKILKLIQKYNSIDYLGPVYDKKDLEKLFLVHDLFVMPSKAETFGLVYIEALSQGIPIVNTKNEGIYGMYDNVGESVYPDSITDIAFAISKIRNKYDQFDFDPHHIIQNHNWKLIAKKYLKLYQND